MMPGSLEAGLTSGGWNPQFFEAGRHHDLSFLQARHLGQRVDARRVHKLLRGTPRGSPRAAAGGWPVFHTLALTLVFGPVGLCSH